MRIDRTTLEEEISFVDEELAKFLENLSDNGISQKAINAVLKKVGKKQ